MSRPARAAAADDTDWRRNPSSFARFTTKLNGLLKHTFTSRPVPEWEQEISARPGIIMHPRVSKLAQSAAGNCICLVRPKGTWHIPFLRNINRYFVSTDGVILEDLPRVYSPNRPLLTDTVPKVEIFAILKHARRSFAKTIF
jgi:hypothetical protein